MARRPQRTLPWGLFPAIVTVTLLTIPLVAMRYTEEVRWDAADFLLMGALLVGTGLGLEWSIRRRGALVLRAAWALALLSTCLMVWANMAVGLLGGESNPVNALLLTVPVLGVAGALLSRLQPRGMTLTMLAMAALQLALTALAFSRGLRPLRQGPIDIWGPGCFFAMLFLIAGMLFWRASAGASPLRSRAQGANGVDP